MPKKSKQQVAEKIDDIIQFIYDLASGHLQSRIERLDEKSNDHDLDAVIEGLNMLAEELHATTVSRDAYKESEEKLRIAKQQAEQASHAKSQFLSNMSHEIRTPLGAIIGFNDLLVERSKDMSLPEDFLSFQHNIQESAEILSCLINNVLDLSKIEAGKLELVMADLSINTLLKNIVDTYGFQANKKQVTLSYAITTGTPDSMHSDRIKVMQILTNLVGNAIKFTPENKHIKIEVCSKNNQILFNVIDQGIGIAPDHQQSIFKAFEQADNSISNNFGGTGLGLAITTKLVAALKGSISVTSTLGVGSTFQVSLPFSPATLPFEKHDENTPKDLSFSPDNIILVVEDNLINQTLIVALLEDFGLNTLLANNGKQGVDMTLSLDAKGTPPDLIIMDMQMPVMGGLEATQIIRANPLTKNIPIVALSADAFSEQKTDVLKKGINEYLTKPIELDKLRPLLKKYLRV